MARPNPPRGTAITLGTSALGLIGVGLIVMTMSGQGIASPEGGILVRSGAVLGAVSLVVPTIRRPSTTAVVVSAAGLALAIARAGLVWAVVIGWVCWRLRGQRRVASSES